MQSTQQNLSVNATAEERIMVHTDRSGECWMWTAYKLPRGYGLVSYRGKRLLAHRLAYEAYKGSIPAGMVIDHLCHTPSCVNPAHLQAVSQKQNVENRRGPQANSLSGVRGVHWHKRARKWAASVGHRGEVIYLGLFERLEDAEAAAKAARSELFTNNLADQEASPTSA